MLLIILAAAVIQAVPATCDGAADCEAKWGRALRWVVARNPSLITSTESLIVTDEPLGRRHKYQVTRIADGGGRYTIQLATACTAFRACHRDEEKQAFAAAVMTTAP